MRGLYLGTAGGPDTFRSDSVQGDQLGGRAQRQGSEPEALDLEPVGGRGRGAQLEGTDPVRRSFWM